MCYFVVLSTYNNVLMSHFSRKKIFKVMLNWPILCTYYGFLFFLRTNDAYDSGNDIHPSVSNQNILGSYTTHFRSKLLLFGHFKMLSAVH